MRGSGGKGGAAGGAAGGGGGGGSDGNQAHGGPGVLFRLKRLETRAAADDDAPSHAPLVPPTPYNVIICYGPLTAMMAEMRRMIGPRRFAQLSAAMRCVS